MVTGLIGSRLVLSRPSTCFSLGVHQWALMVSVKHGSMAVQEKGRCIVLALAIKPSTSLWFRFCSFLPRGSRSVVCVSLSHLFWWRDGYFTLQYIQGNTLRSVVSVIIIISVLVGPCNQPGSHTGGGEHWASFFFYISCALRE